MDNVRVNEALAEVPVVRKAQWRSVFTTLLIALVSSFLRHGLGGEHHDSGRCGFFIYFESCLELETRVIDLVFQKLLKQITDPR